MELPLSQPDITAAEQKAVLAVLRTKRLAMGPKVLEFESQLAKLAKVKYAVAVNSGTSALHLIIRALGIGAGDEVITTPFSFIASSNCILYQGAKPVFVDIEKNTFNIDVTKIERAITQKTKAILAVDVFSHPADWSQLQALAKKHNLFLIEDSAEALGSTYQGKPCGSFGDAGVFAFYPNKQITTGEGGVVLTNNKTIADFCRSSANQGRKAEGGQWLEHVRLGYNYRLDEMSSALGLAQLSRLPQILKKRQAVANQYQQAFKGMTAITLPKVAPESTLSWFVYVVVLEEKLAGQRPAIIKKMAQGGIRCSNYFQPIHLQPLYQQEFGYQKGAYPVCENISARTIALPFFSNLKPGQVRQVATALKKAIHTL